MRKVEVTLGWCREKKPLVTFREPALGQDAERTPAELRQLAQILLRIADDAEKREDWEQQRGAIIRTEYGLEDGL